jgi:hypothetical protein
MVLHLVDGKNFYENKKDINNISCKGNFKSQPKEVFAKKFFHKGWFFLFLYFMRVPYPLIKRFVEGHHLDCQRELAVFLKLKLHFHNSVIYNYSTRTIRSVSEKTGISISSVRKYINIFIDCGWCHLQGNNLILKSLIEIAKMCGCVSTKKKYDKIGKIKKTEKLVIKKTHNVKDIICEIRFQVVLKKKRVVDKYVELCRDYEKSKTLKSKKAFLDFIKKIKKMNRYFLGDKTFILKNGWSATLKTIARNIGRMSKSTACRMMKHSQLNKRVEIKMGEFKFIEKYDPLLNKRLPENTFVFMGHICKREVNKYTFL